MEDCIYMILKVQTFFSSFLYKQLLYLYKPFTYHLHGKGFFFNDVEMTKYLNFYKNIQPLCILDLYLQVVISAGCPGTISLDTKGCIQLGNFSSQPCQLSF